MPQRLAPAKRWREVSKDRTNTHLDWCADPRTHELLETALAEYAMKLAAPMATDAAACHYKLEGARALIDTLLNLGEVAQPPRKVSETQLEPT